MSNKYKLLAVLVHSGGIHGGHYYAFIRPDGTNWLKFDDEQVEKATEQQAVQENWGGSLEPAKTLTGFNPQMRASRFSNAYMLVYVRESEWDDIMCDVDESDIADHIRARLRADEEEKERRRKEKAEAHLFTSVRIATDADMKRQIGSSLNFDLVDMSSVELKLKMKKKALFSEVQKIVEQKTGIPVQQQRFWKFITRKNGTTRPSNYLEVKENSTIQELQEKRIIRQGEMTCMDLYLECVDKAVAGVPLGETTMSIFFKRYVPPDGQKTPRIEYAGQMILNMMMNIEELIPVLKKRFNMEGAVLMFEEVKSEPTVTVEVLDPSKTAHEQELDDGDIIIFQGKAADGNCKFPTADVYLQDIKNRTTVLLQPLMPSSEQEEKKGTFKLNLMQDMPYNEVSQSVATHLGLDHPLKLRFTGQSPYTLHAKAQPFKYSPGDKLSDMYRGVPIKPNVR